MRNKEKEICSFEEFVEKETNDELEKILATYFINKYNIEETKAIQEVNKMIGGIK